MFHGINIIKCSGLLLAASLLSAPLQDTQADNSYGFNMDEAVNIMQKEKLRLQYNRRYQQQHKQKRTRASRRVTPQKAHQPAQRRTSISHARQATSPGGCTDCYNPSSARPLTPTGSTHTPVARVAVPDSESLFLAATNGDVSSISRLLSQGVNVNAMNSERETALHMAAARGHYPAVIYLINHGAQVNAHTIKNWVPLHHAVRFRHANIANYLLKHGSSAFARTSDGISAIDMARRAKDQRMLNILGAR